MELLKRFARSLQRLQWKLTLSYTAVTVGSLSIIVLILVYFLVSKVLVPIDILNTELAPRDWIRIASTNTPPAWRYILSQRPLDTQLISLALQDSNLQITEFDLFRVGDLQLRARTLASGYVLFIDPQGVLLGFSQPGLVSEQAIGKPLDLGLLPGLEVPVKTALAGELDPDRLFVTLEPNERYYFAIPYFDESDQEVVGAAIVYFESLPTENDMPANMLALLGRSVLLLLLAAGLVGTIFGALTAQGMVNRLQRVSEVTGAWSQGDFSEFIADPAGDEIGQLAERLNDMAEQLQHYLKRSQEMAVSEERSRLARDLHDSAKQQALAASFHLGTALTLFERDPESAKDHLVEADHLVDTVRTELTDLIHELRPPAMDGARFDETINEYLIEWAHQSGIEADLQVEGDLDLPLEIKQALYRIMQEALANAARHSQAESVALALTNQDHLVVLNIQDDGIGFDPLVEYAGLGLDSMRERAEMLAGTFQLESALGQGTTIRVTIPLRGREGG